MSSTVILIVLLAACLLMHLVGHGHGGHAGRGHRPGADEDAEPDRESAERTGHRHH